MNQNYYDNLEPVASFIEKYKLNALKSLGQNFILDLNLTDRIAKSIPNIENSVVVEIGSGPGALTRAILKNNPKKLIAIEFDTRAIGVLEELKQTYGEKLEIIHADALTVDFKDLKERFAPNCDFRICANLPYNISIPLTIGWIKNASFIDSMTLMYQLEVGKRITAHPRSKDYGRISIITALTNRARLLFQVPRTCFSPPPKVTSCIVGFEKLPTQLESELLNKVEEVVKQAFSERRKMIRGTLKPLFKNIDEMNKILDELNIKPTSRAEELSPHDFLNISKYFI